jgi:chemotaxis protein CheX
MVISDADLRDLIEGVWAPSVGLPVLGTDPVDGAEFAHAATLRFTGGWNGHVCIDASDGFARALAGLMFGLPDDEVAPEDERDALGEMANVLGGSVKAFAPDEVDLALPVTGDPGTAVADGTPVATSWCELGGAPVRVVVRQDV